MLCKSHLLHRAAANVEATVVAANSIQYGFIRHVQADSKSLQILVQHRQIVLPEPCHLCQKAANCWPQETAHQRCRLHGTCLQWLMCPVLADSRQTDRQAQHPQKLDSGIVDSWRITISLSVI